MSSPASRPRVLALDLLRGYFLCVIVVDHLYRFPSLFQFVTGKGELWVSAAEGFFIISGILLGIRKNNPQKIWLRALKLYIVAVGFTLFFTLWGNHIDPLHVKYGLWVGADWGLLIKNTLLLRYIYGWTDFLAYYAVFLTVAPVVGYLLSKPKGPWLVLVLSFWVWLWGRSNIFMAWQILFVGGMVAGRYLPQIEKLLGAKSAFILIALTLITAVISSAYHPDYLTGVFDKDTLGPGRLALSWIWFGGLYLWTRRHEVKIDQWTRGVIKTLGQNSLLVYVLHGVILFPAGLIIPVETNFLSNSLIDIGVIILIYGVTVLIRSIKYPAAKMIR